MSVLAALLFGLAVLLFLLDFAGWLARERLQSLALAAFAAGTFLALADNSVKVHF